MFSHFKRKIAGILAAAMIFSCTPSVFASAFSSGDDVFDKSTSIMGIIYNEIRLEEIEWASKLRSYGTVFTDSAGNEYDNSLLISGLDDDDAVLMFTEEMLSVEEYVNSTQGELDQLTTTTADGETYGWVTGQAEEGTIEGIIGPEPFEGASVTEYKILTEIDGGNTLEIRGKPQEGYTSNAKEIAAMTDVFFSQTIDAIEAEVAAAKGWKKTSLALEMVVMSIGTWAYVNNIPILGSMAAQYNLSYTTIARTYSSPLVQYSHVSYFYLAKYIYPTRWTVPDEDLYDAGGGTAAEMNASARSSDHEWNSSQSTTDTPLDLPEDSNANVGIGTEGGTNKTTSEYESSLGDDYETDGYVEIEYCPEDEFGGFGCVQSDTFAYKWTGSFASQKYSSDDGIEGLVITDSDAVQTLYYGEDYAYDVSDEVSVFDSVIDDEHTDGLYENYDTYEGKWNWQDGSCIVHPTALNDTTVQCWEFDSVEEVDSEDVVDLFGLTYSGSDDADNTSKTIPEWTWEECEWYESAVREYLTNTAVGTDYSDWMVAGFEETDEGFYIYLVENPLSYVTVEKSRTVDYEYDEYYEEYVYDEDGNVLYDDDGNPITYTASRKVTGTTTETWNEYYVDYENTGAVKILFNHACLGADGLNSTAGHTGTYCGGHLQLKIRGVVYGLSEEQMYVGEVDEDENAFIPKYLDPTEWDESTYDPDDESTLPTEDDVSDTELAAYEGEGLTVWNVNDHIYDEDDANYNEDVPVAYISADDMDAYYDAEDIFDIDCLIHRDISEYPGYNSVTSAAYKTSTSSDTYSSSTSYFWRSWTETNMSQVASLVSMDWKDMYDLPDTQTIVGGVYTSTSELLNDADDTVQKNILELLGYYDLPVETADITDPEATGLYDLDGDGEADTLTAYERERIDRLRHLVYAFDTIGEVTYSQSAHKYYYGDIAGHASDCSGYVSNIWRDRLNASTTYLTSGLYTLARDAGALHEFTGVGTEGIDVGDIILSNPNESGAHALLYVGEFTEEEIYGDGGDTTVQVYTIDCSSMALTWSYLEIEQEDDESEYPTTAMYNYIEDDDASPGTYAEVFGASQVEDDPIVYSGNVRFAARGYVQNGGESIGYTMYYIDMTALEDYIYSGTNDDGETVTVEEGDPEIKDRSGNTVCTIDNSNGSSGGLGYSESYVEAGYVSEFLFDFDFMGDTYPDYWSRHTTDTSANSSITGTLIATTVTCSSYERFREYVSLLEEGSDTSDIVIDDTYSEDLDYTDMQLFIAVVWAEAESEGYTGQLAVAFVVLNRMRLDGYPSTLSGVVYQSGQFTSQDRIAKALKVLTGSNPTSLSAYSTIVQAINDAIEMTNEYQAGDTSAIQLTQNGKTYDFSAAHDFRSGTKNSGTIVTVYGLYNQYFWDVCEIS